MLKKVALLFLSLILLAAGQTFPEAKASGLKDRATWLWNPWMIATDEAGTLAFLESKKVNKVYVQIDRDVPTAVYRSFIAKASAKGMRVYALDGAPAWMAPKGYTSQDQLMTWLGKYQSGSAAGQTFSGIHLDVEPYLYSGWSINQAATVKSYQTLLLKAKASAASLKLPLEADVPFWFDEISYKNTYGKGLLAEWVILNTNSVTIMAYRDSASLIAEIVKNEIAMGAKHGKTVAVGVETGETSEGEAISFFEEGEAVMNAELAAVESRYASAASFGGTAIHHVGSWMSMQP